jgi:hydroxypyruvate reductase
MPNLRQHALGILKAALKAADPVEAVLRHLKVAGGVLIAGQRRYELASFRHIYVLGAGKASAAMARAVERLLGRRIADGLINVKYGHVAKLRRVRLNECGHPVPDENGVRGASEIAQIASQAGRNDLVLCLISGGGSALLPMPAAPITLEEKQAVTKLLLACGASIHEINAVRKHISLIKGGQLARLAHPATVISLLLSDVIGDDLDVIGSGPTAPDFSTFAGVREILERYQVWQRAPSSVRDRIERGIRSEIAETPKQTDPAFRRTQNLVVGSNRLAVDAAVVEARRRGFRAMVLSTFIEGEAREVARVQAAIAKEILNSGRPLRPPACVISGGETTVTLRGTGLGGRNQELVLAAAIDIAGLDHVLILSAGTDGTDGPTDAAGAIADGQTIARSRFEAKQYLADNNSYRFFEPLGDLIKTGPTNTNVMDITIVLCGK